MKKQTDEISSEVCLSHLTFLQGVLYDKGDAYLVDLLQQIKRYMVTNQTQTQENEKTNTKR